MTVGTHPLPGEIVANYSGLGYGLARWAEAVTGGLFWVLLLIGFCVILAMGTQRFGGSRSFGFASVAGMFGAVWLLILELIPWWIGSIFILTGAIGFVVMIMNER